VIRCDHESKRHDYGQFYGQLETLIRFFQLHAHMMALGTCFGFGHVFVGAEDKSCNGQTVDVD